MNNPNKENEEIEEMLMPWDGAEGELYVPAEDREEFIKIILLSKDQKIQDLKTIPSEALIQELINRGYTKIEDISPE